MTPDEAHEIIVAELSPLGVAVERVPTAPEYRAVVRYFGAERPVTVPEDYTPACARIAAQAAFCGLLSRMAY